MPRESIPLYAISCCTFSMLKRLSFNESPNIHLSILIPVFFQQLLVLRGAHVCALYTAGLVVSQFNIAFSFPLQPDRHLATTYCLMQQSTAIVFHFCQVAFYMAHFFLATFCLYTTGSKYLKVSSLVHIIMSSISQWYLVSDLFLSL